MKFNERKTAKSVDEKSVATGLSTHLDRLYTVTSKWQIFENGEHSTEPRSRSSEVCTPVSQKQKAATIAQRVHTHSHLCIFLIHRALAHKFRQYSINVRACAYRTARLCLLCILIGRISKFASCCLRAAREASIVHMERKRGIRDGEKKRETERRRTKRRLHIYIYKYIHASFLIVFASP